MMNVASIPERLAILAAEAGAAPALMNLDGLVWSRAQLIHQISRLIERFNDCTLGHDSRIALATHGGIEAAWAFLAAASYATALPLNPDCGQPMYHSLFSELQPAALLTNLEVDSPVCKAAQQSGIRVISLPEIGPAMNDDLAPTVLPDVMPTNSALILSTSGTTSAPKHVALTHAHLLASVDNIQTAINLETNDRCLSPMPMFHSHGLVAGLLAPLLTGGSVIMPDAFDAQRFLDAMERLQPTWYTAVPTLHQAVIRALADQEVKAPNHTLRLIRSASAPLPPDVMRQLEQLLDVPVIETYGMSEAANQITSNRLPPQLRKPGSAGLPIGLELRVVDIDSGKEAPVNTTGEVRIRGASLVSCYDNNPDATACAFVDGWFRTGDMGYLDEDGYLFLVGRSREFVNRGGEKVAPRIVEEALLTHSAVGEATAFAVPHPTLGEDLAAAVVLRNGADATEQALRRHLFDQLAGHMIPSRVLVLDDLPKGPTHKPLRVGLAKQLHAQLAIDYVAPATPFECKIAEIWEDVLTVENVGRDDNFFALGGDSLSAVRVVSRIHRATNIALDLRDVFRLPVLRDQACLLIQRAIAADRDQARAGGPTAYD